MRHASATAAFLLASFHTALAQQPVPLHNGQQVTLHGTLTMRPAGRLQFSAIHTAEAYLPMVQGSGKKEQAEHSTHEPGLSGYNRYDLLYAHRGQAITVTGTVLTDSASP